MKKIFLYQLGDVNRESVIRRITEEESKRLTINRNEIAEGIAIAAKVRKSSRGWNSTEEIRKWRDQGT